jgi:hypothetical protein
MKGADARLDIDYWASISIVIADRPFLVILFVIGIPVLYTLLAGASEFLSSYFAKGGAKESLRIYTDDNGGNWTLHTGEIPDLVDLHHGGKNITYIEPTVRLSLARFSPLGINLSFSAITLDLALLVEGNTNNVYLVVTLAVQIVLTFVTYFLLQGVQEARPDQVWSQRLMATGTIFLGFCSMILPLLALDDRFVNVLF